LVERTEAINTNVGIALQSPVIAVTALTIAGRSITKPGSQTDTG